jgi:transcriptional antiterminator RfaH
MHWYVLYTKPRNEKKVADGLHRLGMTAYCPLHTQIKQWSDRKKKVSEPLFRSYVFVQLPEERRQDVFQVPGVVRYLFWLGKPAIVRNEEIAVLQRGLSVLSVQVAVTPLQPGQKITLTEGPFKGQTGTIQRLDKTRIQLALESLGVLVSMEWEEA